MHRLTFTALLSAILTGCMMAPEPVQIDTDTYSVSGVAAPAAGGIAGAQNAALKAANKKCADLGKSIHVTNIETGHEFPANGRAIVTFRCT